MYSIVNKIKFIVAGLTGLIIFIIISTIFLNQKDKQDATVINIAGKQRMLTQKISKNVFYLKHENNLNFSDLDLSIEEFRKNLRDLRYGNAERGISAPANETILGQIKIVESLWNPFYDNVARYKEQLKRIVEKKKILFNYNDELLKLSDKIVKNMVKRQYSLEYIDVSGRQRMLTQRMAYATMRYLSSGDAKEIAKFKDSFDLYTKTIEDFKQATKEDTSVHNLVLQTENFWLGYSSQLYEIIAMEQEVREVLENIYEQNVVVLQEMDNAVSLYENFAKEKKEFLEDLQYFAGFLSLIFIIYVVVLVKNVEFNFKEFLHKAEDLVRYDEEADGDEKSSSKSTHSDELDIASDHMDMFLNRVYANISKAIESVEESKRATSELEKMSENIEEELDITHLNNDMRSKLELYSDKSEDVAIQSLEELKNTSDLLKRLQTNLREIIQSSKN